MSRKSPEKLIRRTSAAFNEGGIEAWRTALRDFYDEDIEYHDSGVWPGAGAYSGRAAVVARFEELIEVMGMTEVVIERVVESGEEVAWATRIAGRSHGGEVPHEHTWGWFGRLADGKLVYLHAYYDAQQAFDAIGCSDTPAESSP